MKDLVTAKKMQSGLAVLKSRAANKRLSIILEILTENHKTPISEIADALGVSIQIAQSDLSLLIERNDSLAIKHRDFFQDAKDRQRVVKNLIFQNQFSSDSEIAQLAGLTEEEYQETLQQVREANKNGDESINVIAKRQALVNDYMARNPGKPLVFIAEQMGISMDRLLQDKQLMSDPKYIELQEHYIRQGLIQEIGNDILVCDDLRKKSSAMDPRHGTRWQEEKTKLQRFFAEITGTNKRKIEVNMTGEKTKEERDAVVEAAVRSHTEKELDENQSV